MTQAHGGPTFGPVTSAGEFGATTVSGQPRSSTDGAATSTTPVATEPARGLPAPEYRPVTAGAGVPGAGVPGAGGSGAGVPGSAGPNPAAKASLRARPRGPRRARLQLRHINPWTVLKFSCVLSIALFFVWLIVVGLLYGVLDVAGVINKVNDAATTINGSGSKEPVTAGLVFGGAAIIGVINIVLFVALSTIGSIIYNLCADLVGGVELTLSEG